MGGNWRLGSVGVADGQILLLGQSTLETLADGGSLKWRRFQFESLDGILIGMRNESVVVTERRLEDVEFSRLTHGGFDWNTDVGGGAATSSARGAKVGKRKSEMAKRAHATDSAAIE